VTAGLDGIGAHSSRQAWETVTEVVASSEPYIPPRTAERDEGLVAQVVPALDRDNMDAQHHIGGGDAD
jgi:hypothetical protein